jgi:HK97 family phage major capsid protein
MRQVILEGLKQALHEGKATVNLAEASALTGSGSGVGGRVYNEDVFASLRYWNPFRVYANQTMTSDSDIQFTVKTGNAANATNPWGYTVNANSGSPNIATSIWQLPMRVISAQMPIRAAAMDDINGLDAALAEDLAMEFSQIEAASMAINNDQAGSTTTSTGATNGLRGLKMYAGTAGSTAAYGSSGTAITNGIHTLNTVGYTHSGGIEWESLVDVANALPGQFWRMPGTAWMMHPTALQTLREYTHAGNSYALVETGEDGEGPGVNIMGWPVIVNPYLDAPAIGASPIYLANWPRFMWIVDHSEMTLQRMEQTQPGTITIYAEKRLVSTVRDVTAGVRLIGA